MKALTIYQPWATLILIGAKPYEFRKRKPPKSLIGERIAIHASARAVRKSEVERLLVRTNGKLENTPCLHPKIASRALRTMLEDLSILPLGHVVCTAVLGEPKPGIECAKEFGLKVPETGNDSERDDHFHWGWPLTDIEPLEPPLLARGQQGFWNWMS